MYSRLLFNFCERSLHRSLIRIKLQNKAFATNENKEKRQAEICSTRFPGYKVIYTFPYIKYAGTLNGTKRRFTYFTAVTVPVMVGLQLADLISFEVAVTSIISGIIIAVWLHTFGILCNNLVGYIYLNLDEQKVILSYTDYWGKRVNFKSPLNDIIPLSDNPISITDSMYRKILFSSQKRQLKINLKLGQIIDTENFQYIIGMD